MQADDTSPRRTHKHIWKTLLHSRRLYLGVFLVLLFVVLLQLLYPRDRALPFMRIGGSVVGGQTFEQAVETIRYDFSSTELALNVPGKPDYATKSSVVGIVPRYRDATQSVTEYTTEARLVPFSFVYKMLKNQAVGYEIDEANLKTFYETFKPYCERAPKDAAFTAAGNVAKIDAAQAGQHCELKNLRSAVTKVALHKKGSTVAVVPEVVAPKVTDADLSPHLQAVKAAVARGVTVKTAKDEWRVEAATVAAWFEVKVDKLAVKREAVAAYLESLRGSLYVEPGVTSLTYVDGNVASRVDGRPGQGIDGEVTTDRISQVMLAPAATSPVAWVQLTVIPAKVTETRQYSATNQGLQAMIEQWEREHSARYGIMVRDLSGKEMNAEFNGDRDFITASTYKMFLAYAVMSKIEKNELSFDDQTDMGLSVRACIDEMILHSTNACATSLMNKAGWNYVHTFIKGQFPATSLDNGANSDNEKHTTIRDETNFFIRLHAGQLMNADNTNYLLGLMKRQIYRSGVVKGVPAGVTVANKVGFYNGYKHDVGIIYAARGTYVFGMLTYGGNDSQIADLSRKVYDFLNR